jgi:cytochrome c553
MTTKLRELARNQSCVRCHADDETVVLAHYFGPRRHSYGGGMSIKGHDLIGAHLCKRCHEYMDTTSRDKANKYEMSEEFLHLCALTILRLVNRGKLHW